MDIQDKTNPIKIPARFFCGYRQDYPQMCTEWQSTIIAKTVLKRSIKWGTQSAQLQHLCALCPWTIAHQAPLSMGFSRQEYWSGLSCPLLRDLPNPGIKPRSPTLQGDSLPAEPPGKPKNTGVGSLSLLQGIFPTRESNPGLLQLQANSFPAELPGKLW